MTQGKCKILTQDRAKGRATLEVNGPCVIEAEWKQEYGNFIILVVLLLIVTTISVSRVLTTRK